MDYTTYTREELTAHIDYLETKVERLEETIAILDAEITRNNDLRVRYESECS